MNDEKESSEPPLSAGVTPQAAPRFCDIVMKGGITSGIVYPAAIYEISKAFVFKNVGGTSAGAIAAALTAAAERRRSLDGSMDGFVRISEVPKTLASDGRLYKLFAPNRATRSLYRTVAGLFGRPRFEPALLAKWCGLVWAYPVASLIGATLGTAFMASVFRTTTPGIAFAFSIVAAAATVVLGSTVAIGIALVYDICTKLPKNCYGLVTGVDDVDRSNPLALCTWLEEELEATAGLDAGRCPLTFGMLWDAKRDVAREALAEKPLEPDVNLEMITTSVTWGRPYQFPLDLRLFYDPAELRAFFPDHVVRWMQQRPRLPRGATEAKRFAAYACEGKLPLPAQADIPVIVATRMSLAFPLLLSAVPLYAPDFTKIVPPGEIAKLERCWFSDGGISSNFPITMFDSPLPRWPTLAINLAPFTAAHPQENDESKNVYMPLTNAAGRSLAFSRFESLPGFLSAIFSAMQNWNDNTQSRLPGYRDRIATVLLAESEGGLNLDMPCDVLERLRLRGAAAGAMIAGRFAQPSLLPVGKGAMDWENHRWLRFRSLMGSLRAYLPMLENALRNPLSPDVPYHRLITAETGTPVHRYPIATKDRAVVGEVTENVATLSERLRELRTLDDDLPRPPARLVVRPSLER